MNVAIPHDIASLMAQTQKIAGLRLGTLAQQLQLPMPDNTRRYKGWIGQLLEKALGTSAGNQALPDFTHLGIELKTIPVNPQARPYESTFICSAPLTDLTGLCWQDSVPYHKLRHVLWLPIVSADKSQALADKTIGTATLWQPSAAQAQTLQTDWEEITEMISFGQLAQITAHHGTYLQLRPKAAHSKVLTQGIGPHGEPILTLPRGFYLRANFTEKILKKD